MLHEGMETHDAGEEAEETIGRDVAGEIVDEPSGHGGVLHPLNEADDFVVGEMVGEERTDDEMRGLRRRIGEYVAGEPLNAACRGAGFGGDGGSVGIEVDAGKFDVDALPPGPFFDLAEGVAVAEADVEDAE